MDLYLYISIESFIKGYRLSQSKDSISLNVDNLMYSVPDEIYLYGLDLLRQSIRIYEAQNNISPAESKQAIPFFRENRRMLVGPEVEMYTFPLFENPEREPFPSTHSAPFLRITLDYPLLMQYCLSENLYLLRCKYDEEKNLQTFTQQMEREYPRFFYDDEHTGFTADSHFFSLLCQACMEVRPPRLAFEKGWQIARLLEPSEVEYRMKEDVLIPFTRISLPLACIRQVALCDSVTYELNYNSLAGFLQSIGLPPQQYLEGMAE